MSQSVTRRPNLSIAARAGLKACATCPRRSRPERLLYLSADGRNVGALRCFVACSYAYASLISVGSLHARPKNDKPTGRALASPIGTVMCGYPATAVTVDGPGADAVPPSPLTRSVIHAGPPVGAINASSRYFAIVR